MPSGSSAALALAAAPAPLPPPPPPAPPLPPPPSPGGPEPERDGLLLRERLAALGLDDPRQADTSDPSLRARRMVGLSPDRPGASETAELELELEEEEEEAEVDGDLPEEEEEEEEDRPPLLLLSPPAAAASQSHPIAGGALGSVLLPAPAFDAREAAAAAAAAGALYGGDDPQGMMAAMLSHAYGPGGGGAAAAAAAINGEQAAMLRRKSVNTTECVPVPSSEHVAEIVGRQGCKIKALRAKTNTYIKTPVRGEEPIFVVTGRKEDVAMAKREILSAAEHFSMIRASRNKNGPALGGLPCTPNLPGQTTVQVRVPYRVVGLVVGPKGATIKRIQQQTHTYIVTPSRDKEPVFEVTGMPENVDRAREEIEMHIAMRTGNYIELNEENDFHYNGTDVSFEGGTLSSAWLSSNPVPPSRTRMISNYRNDSSSSLGSGSTDSYFGSNRLADFSPTSPFSTGNFWFGETLPSVGSEDLAVDSPAFDSLPTSSQTIWTPFEPVNPLSGFGGDPSGNMKTQRRGSQPSTPRLSPTFPEGIEHPLARRVRSDPPGTGNHVGLPIYIPAFSNGTNSYSSSNGGSTSSSPPESRRKHDCVICFENEVIAALVPCGHNLFCMECANKICEKRTPSCPVCQTAVTQAIQIHS
ncbi:RNA-binding E3 ubiquitin-protein ligase MEX3C [Petaurus breviceps papuanus]|uniref:RNA-binding E3 ubiquitin-protein ligase MEX3C n=1 Tax=Petaurus breviceps papuanus TaxID=3040969 RepID=UPI0036DA996B